MQVELESVVLERLLTEVADAHPRECCGILLGSKESGGEQITAIQPASNVHPSPQSHFEINPQALIDAHRNARQGGPQVVGYYHSHPNGRVEPSRTDQEQAARDGAIWAIVAGEELTFWRDGEEGFEPLPYRIVDR